MRKSRFSDEKIVALLRQPERGTVAEVARNDKVREASICAWRKHFDEMVSSDVKRLKALESENAKLKKLLTERDLEIDLMPEISRRKW